MVEHSSMWEIEAGQGRGLLGKQAALGSSSLRKGKRLVTFDFTLLHLSSWYLSCPCVPLLSIEEDTWEKYLKGCKPPSLSFTPVAFDLPCWRCIHVRCLQDVGALSFYKICTNVMPVWSLFFLSHTWMESGRMVVGSVTCATLLTVG